MKYLKEKKGQVFLLVPFIVFMGVLFMMFFVDVGLAYKQKTQSQAVVDASCRAGAYYGAITGEYNIRTHTYDKTTGMGVALVNLNRTNANSAAAITILGNQQILKKNKLATFLLNTSTKSSPIEITNGEFKPSNSAQYFNHIDNGTQYPSMKNATATFWSIKDTGKWVTIDLSDFANNVTTLNSDTTKKAAHEALYRDGNFSVVLKTKYDGFLIGKGVFGKELSLVYDNYASSFTSASFKRK